MTPLEQFLIAAIALLVMFLCYAVGRNTGYSRGFDAGAKIWKAGAEKLNETWKKSMSDALNELNALWTKKINEILKGQ